MSIWTCPTGLPVGNFYLMWTGTKYRYGLLYRTCLVYGCFFIILRKSNFHNFFENSNCTYRIIKRYANTEGVMVLSRHSKKYCYCLEILIKWPIAEICVFLSGSQKWGKMSHWQWGKNELSVFSKSKGHGALKF